MAKPGPKTDDPALKWLKTGKGKKPSGNGNRPISGGEKPPKMPRTPTYFNKHSGKLWREVGSELLEAGLLTETDLPSFEMLCVHFGLWKAAAEDVAKNGVTIEGTRGTRVRNPSTLVMRESFQSYLKLADRFALSPMAAERLGLDTEQ